MAVSGGPDSTALLLGLKEAGFEVVAAHFDHQLRSGSNADARWVEALCSKIKVPLITGVRAGPIPAGSRQAAARQMRYSFLAAAAADCKAGAVALGHTADDAVEGAVLHLIRGTGLAGMRGMPARRGLYVRPLLGTWRSEIIEFLEGRGQDWVEDPSNFDPRHSRVKVRHQLLPRLEADRPGIVARLHRVSGIAAGLQAEAERAARALRSEATAELRELRLASPVVQAECLRQMYAAAGGHEPGLGRRHLARMAALVASGPTGAGLDLPGGLRFRVTTGRVEVTDARPPAPVAHRLQVRPCPGCDAPAAAHVRPGLRLTVGHRSPGLRMRPLGSRGSRKLQDLLVDAKVPRWERDHLALVFAEGRLAWVPGVALSRDFAARAGGPAVHITLDSTGRGVEDPMLESSDHSARSSS